MNLDKYLEASGQSQGEFSRLTGIPQPMVSKWTRISTPSLRHALTVVARSGGAVGLAELLHPEDFALLLEALGDKLPATLPMFGPTAPAESSPSAPAPAVTES